MSIKSLTVAPHSELAKAIELADRDGVSYLKITASKEVPCGWGEGEKDQTMNVSDCVAIPQDDLSKEIE